MVWLTSTLTVNIKLVVPGSFCFDFLGCGFYLVIASLSRHTNPPKPVRYCFRPEACLVFLFFSQLLPDFVLPLPNCHCTHGLINTFYRSGGCNSKDVGGCSRWSDSKRNTRPGLYQGLGYGWRCGLRRAIHRQEDSCVDGILCEGMTTAERRRPCLSAWGWDRERAFFFCI